MEPTENITVVLPVYRNAGTVEPLARRLHAALDAAGLPHHLIYVCDACPEDSLPRLLDLAATDSRVTVLELRHNVGQHVALLIGLAHAQGRFAVLMDADLQDPPEAVPGLIDALKSDAMGAPLLGAVFAGRRGHYESRGRLFTSRLFKRVLHHLTGVPLDGGAFVALEAATIERLLSFDTGRPFLPAMIGCSGVATASIPVERSARPSGRSAYSPLGRLRAAMSAFGCALDCRQGRAAPHARALPPWRDPMWLVVQHGSGASESTSLS